MAQHVHPAQNSRSDDRLHGWKEISAYVKRAVRTVQRWEEDFAFRIRRLPGKKRDMVFAFKEEIDAWMRERSEVVRAANGEQAPEADSAAAPATPEATPRRFRRLHAAVWVVVVVLAAASTGGYFLWREMRGDILPPATYAVRGNTLTVQNSNGEPLWSHEFPFALDTVYQDTSLSTAGPRFAAAVDVDGDGQQELLFAAIALQRLKGELYCFDRHGRVRWRFAPGGTKTYGGKVYEPPFAIDFFRVLRDTRRNAAEIWLSAHQSPWFPAVITKLDAQGRAAAEFWHPGHLYILETAEWNGRQIVLVGGANNEAQSGALAFLDFNNPAGTAPAIGSDSLCADCPAGAPLQYIVFPRSGLGEASNFRSRVREIRVRGDGQLEVSVALGAKRTQLYEEALATYFFDFEGRLRDLELEETYLSVHAEFRALSLIREPFDRRRESAALSRLLYWDGSRFVANNLSAK